MVRQSIKSSQEWRFGLPDQVCAGVNIHFVKGHEKDLDMIAAAGFRFIRMDFVWQGTERTKGNYDWSGYDELTTNLEKRGLSAIYILDYSNPLYEETVVSINPLTGKEQRATASPQHPESIAAFAKWASAAAEHFKNRNIIWEIWNEPNISFWKPKPDVKQYTDLAIATCKSIRTVVPGAFVVGPATSEIPLQFIESLFTSGVLEYLDAVSVHPYRNYSKSPETAAVDYKKLRELIYRYAPAEKKNMPIISSEWGYSSSTKGIPVETQAAYLVRMQLSNLLNNIPLSIWYDWKNDGDDPSEHEENFGTVSLDLNPKAAYISAQTMNSQLKGFTFSKRLDVKSKNDYLLLFKNDKDQYKIAAWTTDSLHSVIIENIMPLVPDVNIIDTKGNILKLKTEENRLVLDLNEFPQYVFFPKGTKVK